jgi:DNA helicase-2/ATP-dependent DNA helicase PcrA
VGREFVDRTAVRSTLAWLRLGLGLWSGADLTEALRRPSRPLHPRIADWAAEQHDVDGLLRLAGRITTERDAQRVTGFALDIEAVRSLVEAGGTTGEVIALVRDTIGLGSSVSTLDTNRHGMNRAAQSDDLTALAQLAALQPDTAGFERWLRDALDAPRVPPGQGVTLATVHRVKGQEWPVVVVHQADADQFPHRLATDHEEERRLFHVAVTRAVEQVTVVSGADPSPFVAELSTEPPAQRAPIVSRTGPGRAAPGRVTTGSRGGATAPTAKPGTGLSPRAADLFARLKVLRRELAGSKPAYTVLSDEVLERIALTQPTTLDELARVRGVGPMKLEQFGAAILAVVEDVTSDG